MLKHKWSYGLAELELGAMHSWGEAIVGLNQWPRPWQKPLKDEPFTFCLYVLPPNFWNNYRLILYCSLGHCTFLSAKRFTSVLPTKWSKGVNESLKLEVKGYHVSPCFCGSPSSDAVFLMQEVTLQTHLTCNKIHFLTSEETWQNVTLIRTIVFSLMTATGQGDKEMSHLCASSQEVAFL